MVMAVGMRRELSQAVVNIIPKQEATVGPITGISSARPDITANTDAYFTSMMVKYTKVTTAVIAHIMNWLRIYI